MCDFKAVVKAVNKISKGEKEGVSKVKDSDVYFDELLNQYPDEMLGKKPFRILVKLLDLKRKPSWGRINPY